MAKKRHMSKLALVIAAVVLLPLAVVGAYFGWQLLHNWGGKGPPAIAQAKENGRLQAPPSNESLIPEVRGPVLKPAEEPKGQIVTGPLAGTGTTRYRVKAGDTVSGIVVAHYGDLSYLQDVYRANPGLTSLIHPGQEIILPLKQSDEEASGQAEQPKIYIVQPRDTLIKIARRLYGDSAMYLEIMKLNRLQRPEAIREGMVLKLPPSPKY